MRNNGCALASLSSFLPDPNRTHQIHLNRAHQTPEAPNPPLLHRSPAAAPAPAIPGGRPSPALTTYSRPRCRGRSALGPHSSVRHPEPCHSGAAARAPSTCTERTDDQCYAHPRRVRTGRRLQTTTEDAAYMFVLRLLSGLLGSRIER